MSGSRVVDNKNTQPTTPMASLKALFTKHFDPMGLLVGTTGAAVGRLASWPVEATSIAMQAGTTKSLRDALKQNINPRNIQASFKSGTYLTGSVVLSTVAFYGLGNAVMEAHKGDPILVQASWGLVTVIPEQVSVGLAAKTVRDRLGLSVGGISRMGWARINAGFFLRHLYGNPATFAAVKTTEKVLEEVVPEKYHPLSSFIAGGAGVWLTHRAGYSFLVAASVQTMVHPEKSMKDAWVRAAQENFIKAGDVRALGRMVTAGLVFCFMKGYNVYFAKNKLESPQPKETAATNGHANFFSKSNTIKAVDADLSEKHAHVMKKT